MFDIQTYITCAYIVTALLGDIAQHDTQFRERVNVCKEITNTADSEGVDTALAVAVGWSETRLTRAPRPNAFECVGPMQIKYKYWCPNENDEWSILRADGVLDNCDTVARGVFALKYYVNRYPKDVRRALCAYGWGTCDSPERDAYVRRTLKTRARIRQATPRGLLP